MVTINSQIIAELGFYPFDDIAWAYDKLWIATADRCSWLPRKLARNTDPTKLWRSENQFVSQTCGWPLVTQLGETVRVVGAFRQTTPESASHFYRSVVVGRVDGTPFDFQGSVAAVNELESLSGWISLIAAIHGPQETWRGDFKVSGSHAESVRMLCRGVQAIRMRDLRSATSRSDSEIVGFNLIAKTMRTSLSKSWPNTRLSRTSGCCSTTR